jgi:hypothetical protein
MKYTRTARLIGPALTLFVLLWVPVAAVLPRGNTVTVVPTTSGPWLCGPAFVVENFGGPAWQTTPARTTPVVPSTGPWYSPMGGTRPDPFAHPVSSPASPILPSPPKPDEILCRPLFTPRQAWPIRPFGAYGGSLRG